VVTLASSDPTNAVRLSWTSITGASGYEVARSVDGQTYVRRTTTDAGKTTWSNSGLVSGATYWYQVRAIINGVAGAYSTPVRITLAPELAPPSIPAQLSVRLSATQPTTAVVLSWQDTSLDEDGFHVERSSDGITFTRVATRAVNKRTYTNGGLTSGQLYWYRIRAFNSLGASAWTAPVSIRTQ
jgi:titin